MDESKWVFIRNKMWELVKYLFDKPYQLSLLVGFGLHFIIQISSQIFSETDHLSAIILELKDNPLAAIIRFIIPFSMPLWISRISRHIIVERETKILNSFPSLNPQPVLEIDINRTITYLNPAGKQLLDPSIDDSANILRLLGSDPFDSLQSESSQGQFPPRIVTLMHRVFLWNGSLHPDGQKMNFFATDISSLKQAQFELISARNEAENASRLKSIFMANMSHEVRTPLNTIIGFTQLLEHSLSKSLSEEEQGYIAMIYEGSDRLKHTVHEILEISLIEAGVYNKKPLIQHFKPLLREICTNYEKTATTKNLNFIMDLDVSNDLINVDTYGMTQALGNLIDNSIKYTKSGDVNIRLRRKQDQLILEIKDTGIGISEEYQQRIYEPFSQASEGYTKEFQGVGLGLALTKRYLDMNQVKLDLSERKLRGTTFTLRIPLIEPMQGEEAERPHQIHDSKMSRRIFPFFNSL